MYCYSTIYVYLVYIPLHNVCMINIMVGIIKIYTIIFIGLWIVHWHIKFPSIHYSYTQPNCSMKHYLIILVICTIWQFDDEDNNGQYFIIVVVSLYASTELSSFIPVQL